MNNFLQGSAPYLAGNTTQQGSMGQQMGVGPRPKPKNNTGTGFGMTMVDGDTAQPVFRTLGGNMNVGQYNGYQLANAEEAARRGGYELLPAQDIQGAVVSLFGPKYAPTPLTEAQFKAKGEYAASPRGPEQDAYAQKVAALRASGLNFGYGEPMVSAETFLAGQPTQSGGGSATQSTQAPTNNFLSGLNSQLGNYDGYTVNNDLDAAEQNLRAMLANAQNNNADASTIGRIQMALDDIGRLGQDRTQQQGMIDQARRDAQNSLTGFGTAYTDVDYRNAQALDGLSRQLDQITNPNLDVELNYDFSDMSGDVDPYREVVQNMRDRRMRELNMLGDDIGALGNTLQGFYGNTLPDGSPADSTMPIPEGIIDDKPIPGGMPLRDIRNASEVYDIRDQLNDALNSLDVYGSGTRSNELRGEIFDQDEIYGQLADQLRGRQGQIETDAQAQLDALAGARLTRPDDIRAFEDALRDLGGQRDLFDAASAADELEQLTNQIQSARSDLERDEAARIARQEIERRRALQTQGGGSAFNSNMTADQYSAYLRNLGMGTEDPYYQTSGFSRGLGLA